MLPKIITNEINKKFSWFSGVPGEIRTHDPQIRNLVLYPTELRALLVKPTKFKLSRLTILI